MAYQIDFTASIYTVRTGRKWILRVLLLAAAAGALWGVYDTYMVYNQPTLNMRLAEYEAVAYPIEEINVAWDKTAKEYNATMAYYRLVGSANPTNFLDAMAAPGAARLGRGFKPRSWSLTTGGECRLDYRYVFSPGDKAEQAKRIETEVVHAVTSIVTVVDGKVEVQGVQVENLLNVRELDLTVKFALPNVNMSLSNKGSLASSVQAINAQRKKILDAKIKVLKGSKKSFTTAKDIMMEYLPGEFGKDKTTKEVREDFPVMTNVLNVAGWFDRADRFIAANRVPVDEKERKLLKETWNQIGDARLRWHRFRELDNDGLVQSTKTLGKVADGIRPFKGILDQYHGFCVEKLGVFVDAYDRKDVGNKPLVETDLKDRVASKLGIARVDVTFKDGKLDKNGRPGKGRETDESVVLVKPNGTYTFSWLHWSLLIGTAVGHDGDRERQPEQLEKEPVAEEALTLGRVADCVRKVLTLGPGYVLDTVKVNFGEDGSVAGATLEGLLPVKEELKKETTKNVH